MKIREAFAGMTEEELKDKYPGIRTIPFFGESAADEALESLMGLSFGTASAALVLDAQPATKSTCKNTEVAENTERGPDVGTAPTDMQRRARRAVKAVRKSKAGESRAGSGKPDANQTRTTTAQPVAKPTVETSDHVEHLQVVEKELYTAATAKPSLDPYSFSVILDAAKNKGCPPELLRIASITYQAHLSRMFDVVMERLNPSEKAEMMDLGDGKREFLSDGTREKIRAITIEIAAKETETTQATTKAEPPTPALDTASQPEISKKLLRSFLKSDSFHEQDSFEVCPDISMPRSRWDAEMLDFKFHDTMRYTKWKEHVNHIRWDLEVDVNRRVAMAKNRMTSAGVPGRW
ncbi:hypothetical protein H2199_006334 [Coniosporium tulheliwenetii]|nr:hypothetical protein H2199_006334 [Cladosporium sp. JES 115]